jgi:nucleoside-diphosphate-sugar epimerase
MIVGSGLVARAFGGAFAAAEDVLVYAAGVSNSLCTDPREFDRERARLDAALADAGMARTFIYCSTCSVSDPESNNTPYVRHKLAMEALARRHAGYLVLRLPQLAGQTPNPHTLLNYLYARIARGERFAIWDHARRNIIDVEDVVRITELLVRREQARRETIAVANATDYDLRQIVRALEIATGKDALFDVLPRGGAYHVDITRIRPLLAPAGVSFDETYLERVLRKYYG